MKAILGLLVGVAFVSGTTFALAASGHVDSRTLGAGEVSITSCQAAPTRLSYDDSVSGVLDVTLSDLDTSPQACGGKWVKVTLLPLGREEIATIPTSGSSVTLGFADVSAEDVRGAKVSLTG